MYLQDQPEFINAVAIGMTGLDPRGLLAELKRIEQALGRLPREQNGPREIDLDLIAYGNLHYFYNVGGSTQLEVPHPRLKERRFVLQPLLDLVPSGEWPTVGRFDHLLAGDPLEIIEC
jgi:2-amino-4-hydroxy-6-hydroxymethyldihydropteridine diphosphokinase